MAEHKPQPQQRQMVRYLFYKLDPAWRRLPASEQAAGREQLAQTIDSFARRMLVRSYSLMGTRGDADFMFWLCHPQLEMLQKFATAVASTHMGSYLTVAESYLAQTRKSMYVEEYDDKQEELTRLTLDPLGKPYLFVYPFVKQRPWYRLSAEERQAAMNEHFVIGHKYPTVKVNTTYSFGLDDQEFVVAFEADSPSDFVDLVFELRGSLASAYTERDTPVYTCQAMHIRAALEALGDGGVGSLLPETILANGHAEPAHETHHAELTAKGVYDEIRQGTLVIVDGEEVAIFKVDGKYYGVSARCTHADRSLCTGSVRDGAVTCPLHGSRFDIRTGRALTLPATKGLKTYDVEVHNGQIAVTPSTRHLEDGTEPVLVRGNGHHSGSEEH